ncbi:hypothetical protein MPTK1_4g21340 [Marchantia polymorpha subsp. ruderalis]|uniref:Uncharacterized protein n=2 Tax=Marchantia polymorpha TaxID=3197 RepID=A0AAF6BC98_MARPO|nr:hypothetical protein MARPO_0090s0087 [Marchantia polymorpha]BBN09632.1 hypothetical protein Mp_4g21340 [Marchantia polymorpha subsp. ruderalis]|eukprot:PTQ33354.1 hypothetical protein MARPO_0090s0087 [Marchantia polymorpha]
MLSSPRRHGAHGHKIHRRKYERDSRELGTKKPDFSLGNYQRSWTHSVGATSRIVPNGSTTGNEEQREEKMSQRFRKPAHARQSY